LRCLKSSVAYDCTGYVVRILASLSLFLFEGRTEIEIVENKLVRRIFGQQKGSNRRLDNIMPVKVTRRFKIPMFLSLLRE
jgi:hypothetical protein